MQIKTNKEIVNYINSLKKYQGYIQFSDTRIRECDIFKEFQDIKLTPTDGFIYEAHFFNGTDSVSIRQINNEWLISDTDISNVEESDINEYISDIENLPKIKMAQVWKSEPDIECEGMLVDKLKKVVFVGFDSTIPQEIIPKKEPIVEKKEKYTAEQKEILLNHFLTMFDDNYINNILGLK